MNQQITDVVGLFVFIAACIFSPDVASVVGPYMAIIIASTIGASFALKRRERQSRGAALYYFGRVVGIAILATVGISYAIQWKWGIAPRLTIAPVAFGLGLIGEDWPQLKNWAFAFIGRRFGS